MQPDKSKSDVTPDPRKADLDQWVSAYLGAQVVGETASADASFRRYFRYQHDGRSLVAMDAPPSHEDCRPFIDVAGRLDAAGVQLHLSEVKGPVMDLLKKTGLESELSGQIFLSHYLAVEALG